MSPLRIGMVSYYLPSESKIGAGWQAHGFANAMAMAGHHVTMHSPCRKPANARYEHVHMPLTGRLRTFRWAAAVRSIDLTAFDVFHAHGDDHLLVGKQRPPHVRTMYGSCFDEAIHVDGAAGTLRMFALGLTELMATFVADRVVGISESSLRWFPWTATRVIPCGLDERLFRPDDSVAKSEAPSILFVGTYLRRKRGKLLHEAFVNEILPAVPDAELWMVCDDAPPADHVHVLGRLSDDELADRYRSAWVFCLPSSYEGFGVPYAEAMASATAVVATPNLGALEVLGRHGVIVAPDALGPAIIELLRDPRRRSDLAESARTAADRFAWSSVVAAYEAVYADVLSAAQRHEPRWRARFRR